jgi:membrane-associated phospholipid phosphatase
LGWGWQRFASVVWISATDWFPYQRRSFVTPSFPGYVSGHSTFSRAGAEVLAAFTGSEFFPGGLGSFTAAAHSLAFDSGPEAPVTLQWGTYFDAADQAGLSRIWGGIHPPADDFAGRRVGSACGIAAWSLARGFFDGTIATRPTGATLAKDASGFWQLRFPTVRGLFYRVQTSRDLNEPFQGEPLGYFLAGESQFTLPIRLDGAKAFFQIIQSDRP